MKYAVVVLATGLLFTLSAKAKTGCEPAMGETRVSMNSPLAQRCVEAISARGQISSGIFCASAGDWLRPMMAANAKLKNGLSCYCSSWTTAAGVPQLEVGCE